MVRSSLLWFRLPAMGKRVPLECGVAGFARRRVVEKMIGQQVVSGRSFGTLPDQHAFPLKFLRHWPRKHPLFGTKVFDILLDQPEFNAFHLALAERAFSVALQAHVNRLDRAPCAFGFGISPD